MTTTIGPVAVRFADSSGKLEVSLELTPDQSARLHDLTGAVVNNLRIRLRTFEELNLLLFPAPRRRE